jgi:hypothetical protein
MAEATCPRCGDWVLVVLDADGQIPEFADCECDGPFGCGYRWVTNEPPRPDLVLEIERMQAMLDELPAEYLPTWLFHIAEERARVEPSAETSAPRRLPPWVDEDWPRGQDGNALRCPCFELSIHESWQHGDDSAEAVCDDCERYGGFRFYHH